MVVCQVVVLIIRIILCPVHRLILLDNEYVQSKKNKFQLLDSDNNVYLNNHSDYGGNYDDAYSDKSNGRTVLFQLVYQVILSDNYDDTYGDTIFILV